MKVLLINAFCGTGSTGRICADIAQEYEREGHIVRIAYGRDGYVPEQYRKYAVRIGSDLGVRLHGVRTRLLDEHGFGSKRATRKFLEWAEAYKPDLLWLHNIHGYYINVEMLFVWIKKHPEMQVKWTLHDCWAFTGHCVHFTMAKCYQWKTGCENCCQKREYPGSMFRSNCKDNFERKRKAFTGVRNMTIITPSQWHADLARESFLGEYPVEVVYNTIDTDVFTPTPSDFRKKYGLEDKKVILGVANVWMPSKGLKDFYRLREMLDDSYVIVLVGLSKKQMDELPKGIIGLMRTNSVSELVEIYTAADIFVNPSLEETFGMTTVEACACGTNAIVYEDTACEEIAKMYEGIQVVRCGAEHIYEAIIQSEPGRKGRHF